MATPGWQRAKDVFVAAWPPLHWKALCFLGGLFLMLNHFHDQGLRFAGSEAVARMLAIEVSPVLLLAAGLMAMYHARRASPGSSFGLLRLLLSTLLWGVIAVVPLVALESQLFPIGHGMSQGFWIGFRHLPFVAVFLAGLSAVGRVYRTDRRRVLGIVAWAPAGLLSGSALVYALLFLRQIRFHWTR